MTKIYSKYPIPIDAECATVAMFCMLTIVATVVAHAKRKFRAIDGS